MKVIGLNGREYRIDLKKYLIKENDNRKRSKHHMLARNLIYSQYNGHLIYEEVKLPGSRNPAKRSALFLDFFIPHIMLAIEVHGEQHYRFCPYFHKNAAGWVEYKNRDYEKSLWCENNNIKLIVFKYSDSMDEWRKQIEYK